MVPGGAFRWGQGQLEVKAADGAPASITDGWQLLGALHYDDTGVRDGAAPVDCSCPLLHVHKQLPIMMDRASLMMCGSLKLQRAKCTCTPSHWKPCCVCGTAAVLGV